MSMAYNVVPREQIEEENKSRFQPWPKGEYQFEIVDAVQSVTGPHSKTPGTPMIKLNLTVYDAKGNKRGVFDNIMSNFAPKILGLCDAIGWEYGKPLDAHLLKGRTGTLSLKIDAERTDPLTGQVYEAKNSVGFYVKSADRVPDKSYGQLANTPIDLDDEIPWA